MSLDDGVGQLGLWEAQALAQRGPGKVRRDAHDPGPERFAAPQHGQRVERMKEGILRDVLSLAIAAKDTVRQRINARGVPVEQDREGVAVTALRALDKPGVDGRGVFLVVERVRSRVRRWEHMLGHTNPGGDYRSMGG